MAGFRLAEPLCRFGTLYRNASSTSSATRIDFGTLFRSATSIPSMTGIDFATLLQSTASLPGVTGIGFGNLRGSTPSIPSVADFQPPAVRLNKSPLIRDVCEKMWEANKTSCNGFVCAVAKYLGVPLPSGKPPSDLPGASAIVEALTAEKYGWEYLGNDAAAKNSTDAAAAKKAVEAAASNYLVIGGLTKDQLNDRDNGHVVVVVPGSPKLSIDGIHWFPKAWWGSIERGKWDNDEFVDGAFAVPYCRRVEYARHALPSLTVS